MKWVTRERVKVYRAACPWLIKRFIDPNAEFLFVPADEVRQVAEWEGATPYDVPDVELGHHGGRCSFEAFLARFALKDPALMLLGEIVHGADVATDRYGRRESAGVKAIAEGFCHLGLKDDHAIVAGEAVVYDALYAYCQRLVADGSPPFVPRRGNRPGVK